MNRTPVQEARLVETDAGIKPSGEGWFVLNVADAMAIGADHSHYGFMFEGTHMEQAAAGFAHFGINVRVLDPGAPAAVYHVESGQEAFLVLSGEAILIIEDEERRLAQWDFVHCPSGTAHVIVGAGSAPCTLLMVGARNAGLGLRFPANSVAAKYGASAAEDTEDLAEAYAGWPRPEPQRFPWPPRGSGLETTDGAKG